MNPVLLLIDLQNDFLRTPDLEPSAGEVIDRVHVLLERFRELSIPVIHVFTTVSPDDDRRMPHWKAQNRWACVEGTEGHSPPESLQPLASEQIIHKTFFSAFEDGTLDEVLRSLKPDTLFVAGVHLHGCVRVTILDAYQRGFWIFVAEDAVASNDPLHAAITRRYLEKRAAAFVSADTIISLVNRGEKTTIHDTAAVAGLPTMIVAGKEIHDNTLAFIPHVSPRQTMDRLWNIPICREEQVSQATVEAQHSWPQWRESPLTVRAEILTRLAKLVQKESSSLAEQMAQEIGKPVRDGESEVARTTALLGAVARHGDDKKEGPCGEESLYHYRPVGVVAIISPWNNPLAIPIGKIAPALLYGNTVVWKPAPAGSAMAVRIMHLLALAGCPPGIVNLVCGDRLTAEAVMSNERVDGVTITGSVAAGYTAQAICARRHIPLQAELGGNNAAIVWPDSNLSVAAEKVAEAAFGTAGQRCTANRRVIVEKTCYDMFMAYLEKDTARLVWGDPLDRRTQVGPVISEQARDRIAGVVSRARGAASAFVMPHERDPQYDDLTRTGCYYPPTIICMDDPAHEIVQEETFGPVLVVQKADSWEHALALCNGVRQGLVAGLFSYSSGLQKKFLADAQAGILKINSATAGAGVESPFGGFKASGIGPPEHGASNREFYTRTQAIYHFKKRP
ncbi:aldehyde dehydrogenase family protein [Candidatus Latescibacterota bacterium]